MWSMIDHLQRYHIHEIVVTDVSWESDVDIEEKGLTCYRLEESSRVICPSDLQT